MGKFCNFLTDKVRKWECVDTSKRLNFSEMWHSEYNWRDIATPYIQTAFKKHFSTGQNECLLTSHPSPFLVCWLGTKHCSQIPMRCQESPIFLCYWRTKLNFSRGLFNNGPTPGSENKREARRPTESSARLFLPSSHPAHLPHLPTQHIFSLQVRRLPTTQSQML